MPSLGGTEVSPRARAGSSARSPWRSCARSSADAPRASRRPRRRRGGGVEVRAVFAGREAEPLLGLELAVVLEVVALETGLAVGGLLGADEAEPRVAEAHAVVGMPGLQHGARDLARHTADGRPLVDPARGHVAHPGLPIRFVHVLDAHAAQVIRQVVVLRARDGVGQPVEPELGEAGQELLEVLAAEGAKDQLGGRGTASPAHRGTYEPGQIGVIERGDGAVASRRRDIVGAQAVGHSAATVVRCMTRRCFASSHARPRWSIARLSHITTSIPKSGWIARTGTPSMAMGILPCAAIIGPSGEPRKDRKALTLT